MEEEGEEGQAEGAEVEDPGIGPVFLFLLEVSQRVSRPGRRVWLGPPRDEQLDGQLVWLLRLLVPEQLLPV